MFNLPSMAHEHALSRHEILSFLIKEKPLISDWNEANISLLAGYKDNGPITLKPWQIEPVNSAMNYQETIFQGPTQTGKSFMADLAMYYAICVLGMSGMVVYNNQDIVRKVFRRRLKPMVEKNSIFREVWSGAANDLKVSEMLFRNCFWAVASAQNRDDIASFPAGFVVWSELSKLPDTLNFDVYNEIIGRQGAYSEEVKRRLLESTPNKVGDPMYKLVYRPGTVILQPHVPCPECGEYQVLVDAQIKLHKSGHDDPDRDTARIQTEKEEAVYYQCSECKNEINEIDRPKMMEKVVWAAPEITERVSKRYVFKQEAERVHTDGTIEYHRERMVRPCYNWNRLVDPNYYFWLCLSRFFDSQRSTEAHHVYLNNDMARYHYQRGGSTTAKHLKIRAGQSDYYATDGSKVPSEVIAVTCGIDTQDDGFWYLIMGWGPALEAWVLPWGFLECSKTDNDDLNHDAAFNLISNALYAKPLIDNNDEEIPIHRCFIDRGGHRAQLVDAVCSRLPNTDAYIGASRPNEKKPVIYKSTGTHYLGDKQRLSESTGGLLMRGSFHIPRDVNEDFLDQITAQYFYETEDSSGNILRKFHEGRNDHLRDCLNMAYAGAVDLGLDYALMSPDKCNALRSRSRRVKNDKEENSSKENRGRGTPRGSYFGNGRF